MKCPLCGKDVYTKFFSATREYVTTCSCSRPDVNGKGYSEEFSVANYLEKYPTNALLWLIMENLIEINNKLSSLFVKEE